MVMVMDKLIYGISHMVSFEDFEGWCDLSGTQAVNFS